MELVKLAQKAENEFVGVKCGIMDQFASVFGKKGHVVRLDCRSLEYTYFPFMMDGIRIVLLDTGVKHSLADSEYNDRRAQCEEGVRVLQRHNPAIRSLRDADREILLRHQREFDPLIFNRCMYVVEENARLLAACDDLSRGDMISFGQRMYGSHNGLRDMYEVSCPELDYLVSFTITEEAVLGARMMGGGFGGCTINLVRDEAVDDLFERARKAYQIAMGRELKMYTGIIEDGTGIIDRAGF
jgi:galactokinase